MCLGRARRTKSGDERDSTRFACAGIDQFQYIKIQLKTIEYEALGNNYRVYGFYSPEPRADAITRVAGAQALTSPGYGKLLAKIKSLQVGRKVTDSNLFSVEVT